MLYSLPPTFLKARHFKISLSPPSFKYQFFSFSEDLIKYQVYGGRCERQQGISLLHSFKDFSFKLLNFSAPQKFQLSCVSLTPKLPGKNPLLCTYFVHLHPSFPPDLSTQRTSLAKKEREVGKEGVGIAGKGVGTFPCPSFFTSHGGR